MPHDSKDGERLAGWYHWGFAAMYFFAMLWHSRGALEHWGRLNGENKRDTGHRGAEGVNRPSTRGQRTTKKHGPRPS
jgi:hypothetical protein